MNLYVSAPCIATARLCPSVSLHCVTAMQEVSKRLSRCLQIYTQYRALTLHGRAEAPCSCRRYQCMQWRAYVIVSCLNLIVLVRRHYNVYRKRQLETAGRGIPKTHTYGLPTTCTPNADWLDQITSEREGETQRQKEICQRLPLTQECVDRGLTWTLTWTQIYTSRLHGDVSSSYDKYKT